MARRIIALADRDPRRAVTAAQRLLRVTPAAAAEYHWFSYAMGCALLIWERFDEARASLERTLAKHSVATFPPLAVRCRYALLLAEYFQRLRADLGSDFCNVAVELEAVGAVAEATHARTFRAGLLNMLGQPGEAIAQLEQSKQQSMTFGGVARGRWLRVRAAAAYAQSEFTHAAELLDEALICFSSQRSQVEVAKCWYEQAVLALRQQKVQDALTLYARAEQVFARLDLPYRRAHCAQEQSIVLAQLGAYDEALERSVRALAYFSALGKDYDVARCHTQLGNIYWFTGCWEAALACYNHAEHLYTATGVTAADLLTVRRNQALAYRALGRWDAAWTLLAALSEQAEEGDDQIEVAEIAHQQAEVLADTGRVDAAITRYAFAAGRFACLGNLTGQSTSLVEQAWLLVQRGEVVAARQTLQEALPGVAAHPHIRWRAEHGLARCAEAFGDDKGALDYYQAACATVAGLRSRLAGETLSSTIYAQAELLHRDALRAARLVEDGELLLNLSDEQRALALRRHMSLRDVRLPHELQAEYDRLVHQLRLVNEVGVLSTQERGEPLAPLIALGNLLLRARPLLPPTGRAAWPSDLPFDVAHLRADMDKHAGIDWTAITYIVLDAELLIVILTHDQVVVERTPYDESLQHLLDHACGRPYRRYTYFDLPVRQGQVRRPWAVLEELGERLLPASACKRLHAKHRLIVIPTGPLHGLPWAALRVSEEWLIERTIIQLAPSLSSLIQLRALPAPPTPHALLLGCTTFGDRGVALPHIADELAIVVKHIQGSQEVLIDNDATPMAVLNRDAIGELRNVSLLHIASHAQLLPNAAQAAFIGLWGGDLWIADIGRLQLGGTLVVLSSCDGASAQTLAGDEALGLSRAFLAAGARGVVASLWPMHDRLAVTVMEGFYSQLGVCGDAAEALAKMQRAFARGEGALSGELSTTPYCWAGLLLVGDGGRAE